MHVKIIEQNRRRNEEKTAVVRLCKNPPKIYRPRRSVNTSHLFNPDYEDMQISEYACEVKAMRLEYEKESRTRVKSAQLKHMWVPKQQAVSCVYIARGSWYHVHKSYFFIQYQRNHVKNQGSASIK